MICDGTIHEFLIYIYIIYTYNSSWVVIIYLVQNTNNNQELHCCSYQLQ